MEPSLEPETPTIRVVGHGVEGIAVMGYAVGRLHLINFQRLARGKRVYEPLRSRDVGRVEVDLGRHAPGAVLGPSEVRALVRGF